LHAGRQFGFTASWQSHAAGLDMQVAGGIGLDRDIGLGQQHRRQLVANDHNQRNQQDADDIDQYFLVHLRVTALSAPKHPCIFAERSPM